MTLKQLESRTDLLEALHETKDIPELLFVHYSIEIQLKNTLPEAKLSTWVYENELGDKIWIHLREGSKILEYNFLVSKLDSTFTGEELHDFLDRVHEKYPNLLKTWFYIIMGQENIEMAKKWVHRKKDPNFKFLEFVQHFFYVTKKQQESLAKLFVDIPDGYHADKVILEKDSQEILDWIQPGEEETLQLLNEIKVQIQRQPYSILRSNETNDLVACFLVDPIFTLKNHIVKEGHRRKGLGNAVERSLCQKLIKFGKTPYKTVVEEDDFVIDAAVCSPYWTRLEKDGQPIKFATFWSSRIPNEN